MRPLAVAAGALSSLRLRPRGRHSASRAQSRSPRRRDRTAPRAWTRTRLAGAVLLVAAGELALPAPALAANPGQVPVRVLSPSGTPVPAVVVRVWSGTGSTALASGTSDAGGNLTLAVADGTYRVSLTPPAGSALQPTTLSGVAFAAASGVTLTVEDGPATVTGRVGWLVDGAFQAPTTRGTVSLTRQAPSSPTVTATPGPDGSFTAHVVAGAAYQVQAAPCCLNAAGSSVQPSGTRTFADGDTLDLAVPTTRVTVTVVDSAGRPVQGAHVSTDADTSVAGPRVAERDTAGSWPATAADGTSSTHVPTGAHLTSSRLHLAGGEDVPVTLPDVVGDTTAIALTAPDVVTVTGRLGAVLDGTFHPAASGSVRLAAANGGPASDARVDTSGGFVADVVAGATYHASGVVCCVDGVALDVHRTTDVPLNGGESVDLGIPTSRVSVTVHDTSGRPVAGAVVTASADATAAANPVVARDQSAASWTPTVADGTTVAYVPLGAQLTGTSVRLRNGPAIPVTLPDATGDQTAVALTVPDTVSVTGRLGRLQGGSLLAAPAGSVVDFVPSGSGTPQTTVQPDAAGTFTASVLAGTPYQVAATTNSTPITDVRLTGAPRSFSDGESLDLSVAMSKVALVLHDQAGHPVDGAVVTARGDTTPAGAPVSSTDRTEETWTATAANGVGVTPVPTGSRLSGALLHLADGRALALTLPDVTGDQTVSFTVDTLAGTVGPATVTPAVALSVSAGSHTGDPATLTATVTDPGDPGHPPAGQVVFHYRLDRGTEQPLGQPLPLDPTGSATLSLPGGLPHPDTAAHTYQLSASFTPAAGSTADAATSAVTTTALAAAPCTTCSDPQNVTATVDPGTLTISSPYTPGNPFDLGLMALSADGTLLSASGRFGDAVHPENGVTITDTRSGNGQWTASLQTSDFVGLSSPSHVIDGHNLGLTGVTPRYLNGNALSPANPVVVNDVPHGVTAVAPGGGGSGGLAGGPHPFATAAHGDGSVQVTGDLDLQAPTSTQADTYQATITFTVA